VRAAPDFEARRSAAATDTLFFDRVASAITTVRISANELVKAAGILALAHRT